MQQINQLLKQFSQMRAIMSKMGNGGIGLGSLLGGGMGGLGNMFGGGGAPAGAPPMPPTPYGGGMYGGYGMRPHGSSGGVSRSQNAANKKKAKQARKQGRKKH